MSVVCVGGFAGCRGVYGTRVSPPAWAPPLCTPVQLSAGGDRVFEGCSQGVIFCVFLCILLVLSRLKMAQLWCWMLCGAHECKMLSWAPDQDDCS